MTLTSGSLPTRPCSTPSSRSRGQLRSRPWPAAEEPPLPSTLWHQLRSVAPGTLQRREEAETAPEAREGSCQGTGTHLPDGTAQTQALGSDQTVVALQPGTVVRARSWGERQGASVTALETDTAKNVKPPPKPYRLPAIGRRGRGY